MLVSKRSPWTWFCSYKDISLHLYCPKLLVQIYLWILLYFLLLIFLVVFFCFFFCISSFFVRAICWNSTLFGKAPRPVAETIKNNFLCRKKCFFARLELDIRPFGLVSHGNSCMHVSPHAVSIQYDSRIVHLPLVILAVAHSTQCGFRHSTFDVCYIGCGALNQQILSEAVLNQINYN